MEAKDLKAIIEQVLQEMNVSSDEKTTAAVAAATEAAAPKTAASEGISLKIPKKGVELEPSVIEDGCLQDITEIDIRKQYLVETSGKRRGVCRAEGARTVPSWYRQSRRKI